jgi:hypothetical protein
MTKALDRYPGATYQQSKNKWDGNNGRRAVVLHIAQGGFWSSVKWMNTHGTSAHFVVALTGAVAQMLSVNDSAWANGLSYDKSLKRWECPHDHVVSPTWKLLDTAHNPNSQTISIEHEGFSGRAMSVQQLDATVRLLRWLGAQFPELLPYRVGETLIGHFHLDPVDKGFCPGGGVDLLDIARRANEGTPQGVEGWVLTWQSRGVELPVDARNFAIPQLYKFHAAELGGCVAPETYLADGAFSIAVFESGFIYWLRSTGRAYLSARFPSSQL